MRVHDGALQAKTPYRPLELLRSNGPSKRIPLDATMCLADAIRD